jgi:DNA polymerase-3 subunit alpha
VISLKKAEAFGQDSLFGELGADEPDAGSFGGAAIAQDAPEWGKKVLLSYEREMLGLYVSDHPLGGAEPLLARNRDLSIPDLLENERTEGPVRIAGLITKVDRKVNQRGETWAAVVVEDLDASIDVLFFPQAYQLYMDELRPDAAVSVLGNLKERDGVKSVMGKELAPLDISTVGSDMPVLLTLRERRVNAQSVAELKRILETYPGGQRVQLNVVGSDMTAKYALPAYRVDAGNGFHSEVKALFGPGVMAA